MKHTASTLVVLLAMCATATAQHDTIALEQVVVTASRHAVSRNEAAAIVDVVDHTAIEQHAAVNLAQGLQLGLGLRVENTCQNCGANELRINGLSGDYTQVLVDSRPVGSALAGVYLMELLHSAMIDRIEVMRGGGSALYGAGAIAGVVNVITRDPLRNSASVGSAFTWTGFRSPDVSTHFNATVVDDDHTAGLALYGQVRQRSPYDRDADGFSELGLLRASTLGARAFLRPAPTQKLDAEYHYIHEYRRGGDRFDLPSTLALISEGGEHRIHSGNLRWTLLGERQVFTLFAQAQHVGRDSYYGERDDDDPVGNAYGYTTDLSTMAGASYRLMYDLLVPAELTAGVEHTFDRLDDRTLASADTLRQQFHVASAYVQNEWHDHMHWGLLVGLRADKHTLVDRPVFSPRVSLRYAPAQHTVLRAAYSSGFRAPQVFDDDLHAGAVQGEQYHISNAEGLRMERSHSLTASADLCFHLGRVEADLLVEGFYTRIGDAFVLQWLYDDTTAGVRLYERRNADGAEVYGLNAELRLEPADALTLRLGGTLQRSRYTGQGLEWAAGRFERRMERTPYLYGFATAEWRPLRGLSLAADGTLTGPMLVYHAVGDDETERVVTPTFFDLTLRAAYTVAVGARTTLDLSVALRNLLDAYQRDLDSGPERDSKYIYGPTLPRSLTLAATLSL